MTQSTSSTSSTPAIVEAGLRPETTIIHEVGHHIGLSHPPTATTAPAEDFEPTDDYFAWLGDLLEHDDELHRPQLGLQPVRPGQHGPLPGRSAVRGANRPRRRGHRRARAARAYDELRRADALLGLAKLAFARHQYSIAYTLGRQAYLVVADGARQAGVDVQAGELAQRKANEAERSAVRSHPDGARLDTLTPDGPRSQP